MVTAVAGVWLPAKSRAMAAMVWVALATLPELQLMRYGAVVSSDWVVVGGCGPVEGCLAAGAGWGGTGGGGGRVVILGWPGKAGQCGNGGDGVGVQDEEYGVAGGGEVVVGGGVDGESAGGW